jgi:hypothetical protein
MRKRSHDEPPGPRVRLTLRQRKLLALIARKPQTPDTLRIELYGTLGTRLRVTESRNVVGGLAVLACGALVEKGPDGSYSVTKRGRYLARLPR